MRAAVRSAFLPFAAATTLAAAATLAAAPARADTITTPSACGATGDCSSGSTSLHAESRVAIMSSIGTGWQPSCASPDASGHCSGEPIQVSVSVDLAAIPSPSVEPLWMVDMVRTAVVDAHWPSTKSFDLSIPTSKVVTDGTFKVSHTLIPAVRVYASLLGFKKEWNYDASRFVTDYAANFHYQATNTVHFQPWAFETESKNLVPAPSLLTTELLNVKLINDGNNDVDLGLGAKTSPTLSYRTTKVTMAGASPLTPAARVGQLPMRDADYLDLNADVEGEITVAGEMVLAPYVAVNKIAGFPVPGGAIVLDLSGPIKQLKRAYTATPPVAVTFPRVRIHIPLPNVKVPGDLDLGSVQIGQKAEKPATISNTGELAAKMTFESSDPQFSVAASADSIAKKDYELNVSFTPSAEGAQSATITMKSNDPDQPSQIFHVRANGSSVPVGAPLGNEPVGASDDSGCGCHTAPTGSSKVAFAGLGLLGVLALRRRRSR